MDFWSFATWKEKYVVRPQRKPVSFQRDDSASWRDVYSTNDSDHGGYDGRYDRNHRFRGGLYGDAYDGFGDCHNAPTIGELPRTHGGNSHYDDNPSSQHEHSRKHENSARSQSHVYGGKRERGLLSSMERGYHAPHYS
ncbi:RNA-binding motif protein, X chromosome-like [Perognathus longimembris pacificus]|uniref:RNA-binding motif protein, X chromosome-like n=1 Tax=Perognathus longimembris pacificus TaxID=214514 RepID=UPI0020185C98|nr:RNA-binding motif protein, X chromosome-like [Perognathus longimembris pacificus]